MNELNFDLLKDLYCVFSPSMGEKKMRRFIKRYVKNNVPDAAVEQDAAGNLFIAKGNSESYPCLCAHMDQVQHFHPNDFTCIDSKGVIFGYSPKTRKQCGLGADDKNGIFIALTCLKKYEVLKCAFFVGEEIGCAGSSSADVSFFSDCRFCIQIDRRGNSDMVTRISWSNICSGDFVKDADCESWGYCVSDGLMTDVEALRNNGVKASCINLSCGYYEPHTDNEFTVKEDVQKCYNFVCHLIDHCTGDYTFCTEFPQSWDDNEWGAREYGYTGWLYDECLDVCCDLLENNRQMSCDEFAGVVRDRYRSLNERDFKEIYKVAKSYIAA